MVHTIDNSRSQNMNPSYSRMCVVVDMSYYRLVFITKLDGISPNDIIQKVIRLFCHQRVTHIHLLYRYDVCEQIVFCQTMTVLT